MRKIVIIGPESTGKTTLAQRLSAHFDSPWVPEYARQYLDQLPRPYRQSDLLVMARGQLALEQQASQTHPPWLFCDTDLRVIKIWSEIKYGQTHPWILQQIEQATCDLYLLLDIDLPWQSDPQREHPFSRVQLFERYRKELADSGFPFQVVGGMDEHRFREALKVIKALSI